jgi:hypothetical protein
MNTVLAAPAARSKAVDVLFTDQSKKLEAEAQAAEALAKTASEEEGEGRREGGSASGAGTGGFAPRAALPALEQMDKYCVDLNTTCKRPSIAPAPERNVSLFAVNLLARIAQSAEALWRNPVRAKISKWSRREVMHVFNGVFHQSITDYETYETFGRCYTCPDPFRNDDPPWKACFCA